MNHAAAFVLVYFIFCCFEHILKEEEEDFAIAKLN